MLIIHLSSICQSCFTDCRRNPTTFYVFLMHWCSFLRQKFRSHHYAHHATFQPNGMPTTTSQRFLSPKFIYQGTVSMWSMRCCEAAQRSTKTWPQQKNSPKDGKKSGDHQLRWVARPVIHNVLCRFILVSQVQDFPHLSQYQIQKFGLLQVSHVTIFSSDIWVAKKRWEVLRANPWHKTILASTRLGAPCHFDSILRKPKSSQCWPSNSEAPGKSVQILQIATERPMLTMPTVHMQLAKNVEICTRRQGAHR